MKHNIFIWKGYDVIEVYDLTTLQSLIRLHKSLLKNCKFLGVDCKSTVDYDSTDEKIILKELHKMTQILLQQEHESVEQLEFSNVIR